MPAKKTKDTVREFHRRFIDNVLLFITETMDSTMSEIVAMAKNTDTYIDRTNNLRSSIGYVLFYDGAIVSQSFSASGKGTEGTGAEGAKKGQKFAEEVAKNYPRGYVAVMVAGMEYAAYVEAKNFDVITGASLQVRSEFEKRWNQARDEIRESTGVSLKKVKRK